MANRRKKSNTRWDSVTFDRVSRKMTREGSHKGTEDNHALALETQPNDAFTLVGLGDLKRKKKQFTEAAHYYQRCLEIEKDNKFDKIAVLTHGGVIRILLCELLQRPITDMWSIPQNFGAINVLEYNSNDPRIQVSTTRPNGQTNLGIGKVMKNGDDDIHYLNSGNRLVSGVHRLHKRASELRQQEIAS